MQRISIKKLGMAFGSTAALLYFGCAMVMFIVGKEGTVKFFNNLVHGLDVSSIARMDISPVEEIIGIVLTFILGSLTGVIIAAVYNLGSSK